MVSDTVIHIVYKQMEQQSGRQTDRHRQTDRILK